jgi:hypothetical protein
VKLGTERIDFAMYLQAIPLYGRNLGVLLAPLAAALIGLGLAYAAGPLFAPINGAGDPIVGFISQLIYGFAFAISLIFADDAWRHGRAHFVSAWESAKRKAGSILMAVLGFYFLIYVAQMIGAIAGPIVAMALGALAVWAFLYAIPAAALGGVPGGAAFSTSLQAARRHPIATALLTIVSLLVYYYVGLVLPLEIGPFLGAGFDAARVLLTAVALGYVALIVSKQYSDFAFRPFW